jgi:hypothetical protein
LALFVSGQALGQDSITNAGQSATSGPHASLEDFTGFTDFTDFPSFQSAWAGPLTTITFTEVPVGTIVTTEFAGLGAVFTDGNDTTLANPAFVEDGIGVDGNGRVTVQLSQPANAIGSNFPGALTIELYDAGGSLIYTSTDFAGSGTGFFGGVISDTPFASVVFRDWVDDLVFLDDIFIGFGAGCKNDVTLTYGGGTLNIGFEIGATQSTTWSTSLAVGSSLVPLFSVPLPAIDPPVSFNIPVPGFPPVGGIGLLSVLSTPADGILCSDWEVVDTGP